MAALFSGIIGAMNTLPRTRRPLRIAAATAAAGLLALAAACGTASGEGASGDGQDNRSAVSLREANAATASASAESETATEEESAAETESETTSESADAKSGNQGGHVALDDDEAPDAAFSLSLQSEEEDGGNLAIRDVRAGAHEGYDRIVIELSGDATAGYRAGYEANPAEQGRGMPITHPGDQALVLYVAGVGYPFELGVEDLTVGTLSPEKTGAVVQVKGVGMFEGEAQYVISIKGERRPFRVFQLDDPQRIIVDVQTSDATE